jgi:hypothetical protein
VGLLVDFVDWGQLGSFTRIDALAELRNVPIVARILWQADFHPGDTDAPE